MKTVKQILFNRPLIQLEKASYLNLLIILVPLMNFISGISIDLYAPSMPALATHFASSITLVKNTVTISMLGFALGAILLGVLFDTLGRKSCC